MTRRTVEYAISAIRSIGAFLSVYKVRAFSLMAVLVAIGVSPTYYNRLTDEGLRIGMLIEYSTVLLLGGGIMYLMLRAAIKFIVLLHTDEKRSNTH